MDSGENEFLRQLQVFILKNVFYLSQASANHKKRLPMANCKLQIKVPLQISRF